MPYVEALGRELELRVSQYPAIKEDNARSQQTSLSLMEDPEETCTLYLGGGTPSQLSAEALHRLFVLIGQHTMLAPSAEVTIEANPDDVTPLWVAALRDTPVNRISMGIQTFDDDILRTIHRRHTADQARRAVRLLQDAGYTNLSLDLIYGLPDQSLASFENDVRQALTLDIQHLSAYALQFEKGTPLFSMREQGLIDEADEELSRACYESLIDLTAEAGMEHYEISNFARPGFRSRHNSSYWTEKPYIGLGQRLTATTPRPVFTVLTAKTSKPTSAPSTKAACPPPSKSCPPPTATTTASCCTSAPAKGFR